MIIDVRPERYRGDLAWDALVALIQAYDTPDGRWQELARGPEGLALRVTRGAHQGAFYPAYGTSYYFDVRTEDENGVSPFDHHALLNPAGTAIIGVDPPL